MCLELTLHRLNLCQKSYPRKVINQSESVLQFSRHKEKISIVLKIVKAVMMKWKVEPFTQVNSIDRQVKKFLNVIYAVEM